MRNVSKNEAARVIGIVRAHLHQAPIGPCGAAAVSSIDRAQRLSDGGSWDLARTTAVCALGYIYSDARAKALTA